MREEVLDWHSNLQIFEFFLWKPSKLNLIQIPRICFFMSNYSPGGRCFTLPLSPHRYPAHWCRVRNVVCLMPNWNCLFLKNPSWNFRFPRLLQTFFVYIDLITHPLETFFQPPKILGALHLGTPCKILKIAVVKS